MLTQPNSFYTAYTEAENNAFNLLCDFTASKPGKNAYIGRSYGSIDSWFFYLTLPVDSTPPYWAKSKFPQLQFEARAEAMFKSRVAIQEWLMRIIFNLPVYCDNTLNEFKIASIGTITPDFIKPANENRSWPIWKLTVGFDVIFETNQKKTV